MGIALCITPWLSLEAQPIAKSLRLWGNSKDVGDEKCQGRACVHAKSLPSCLTLCDTMVCSLPGSSVHGILQARILEWVAMPSSGDLPNPGIEPAFPVAPALQVDSLLLSHQGTAECYYTELINYIGEYGREKLGRVLNYLNSSRIPFV